MPSINDFKPGDSVKINPFVYDNKWPGWEKLINKFWHHNLTVDRVIDLDDLDGFESIVVVHYNGTKDAVKPEYLWKT